MPIDLSPGEARRLALHQQGLLQTAAFGRGPKTLTGKSPYTDRDFLITLNALLVNTVALSAILWRLSTWGLTPNRVVVTGVNLLICWHLVMMVSRVLSGFR